MADVAHTLTTANGWAKEQFGEVQHLAPPKHTKFIKHVKYNNKNKLGKEHREPVWVTAEGGFSYDGATTLEEAKAAESQDAVLTATEITCRSLIKRKLLESSTNDKDSFGNYWSAFLVHAKKSFARRLETAMLYGGGNIGVLGSITGTSTSRAVVISEATWAPHIWQGSKGHNLDAYNGSTQISNAAPFVIASVNLATRTVNITGDSGDLTDLDSAGTSAVFHWRASRLADGNGLATVAALTSGTYRAIDVSTYADTWQSTHVAVGSVPFDWAKLNEGLEGAADKGSECPLIVQVSLKTWGNLLDDIASLRVFDSSYKAKEGEFGVESIKYHGVNGFPVTIEPSGFIKRGIALAFPDTSDSEYGGLVERRGSTDVTYMDPLNNEQMFTDVPGTNYFEVKGYSDQALKANPRDLIEWSGIVNS